MERVFLSIFFLLLMQLHGASGSRHCDNEIESAENFAGRIRLSQRFLVGVKEIAHSFSGYSLLRSVEDRLGDFSNSYRKNNILANVTFSACVLAPELHENSEVLAARLSAHDLDLLHHNIVFIQSYIIQLADDQHLQSVVPLLLRSVNQMNREMLPIYLTTEAIVETCHQTSVLKTFAHIAEGCFESKNEIHKFKNKMLKDMLTNFEKVGALASYIDVGKLKGADNYRVEEISQALNEINQIFQKVDVFGRKF